MMMLVKRGIRKLDPRLGAVRQIKSRYRWFFGKELETNKPIRFTEKVFLRLINENRYPNNLLTLFSDKLHVRNAIASIIGSNYLIPQIWVGQNPISIPFDRLPERSIAKVTHGSGHNIVLSRFSDRAKAIEVLSAYLRRNHYWIKRESWYLPIKGMITIQAYLEDGFENGPLDYRFWCFDGRPYIIQVDDSCHSINPFYDLEWRRLHLSYRPNCIDVEIPKPDKLEEMISVATKLAKGFGFVRVDLFFVEGRIYFGEMTFAPVAGEIRFSPDYWDEKLGALWTIRDTRNLNNL